MHLVPPRQVRQNSGRQNTSAIASLVTPTVARPITLGVIYQMINQNFSTLSEFAGHTVNLTGRTICDALSVTKIGTPVEEGTEISASGVFYEKEWVYRAVELITASSFLKKDVFVLAPDILGSKDPAQDRRAHAGNSRALGTFSVAVGDTLALAAGTGVEAIRGVDPIRVSAPFPSALAGIGNRGLVGGSIDAVDAAGPPDLEAKCYEGHIVAGDTLVTIYRHTPEQIPLATAPLSQAGAR